jgi:hypothetical protein
VNRNHEARLWSRQVLAAPIEDRRDAAVVAAIPTSRRRLLKMKQKTGA